MGWTVGIILYACVILYVLTVALGLALQLAIQLLVLSFLVLLGFVFWGKLDDTEE